MCLQTLRKGENANEAANLEHGEGNGQGEELPEKEDGNHVPETGGSADCESPANHEPPTAKPTAAKSKATKPKKTQTAAKSTASKPKNTKNKGPSKKKTKAWPKTMTLKEVEKSLHSVGASFYRRSI